MPIYEYRCNSCQSVSEVFVRSGKEPTACSDCGEEALQRLISRPAIIFKGPGFYVTDSRSSTDSASGGGASKETKSSESSSTTESKPKSDSAKSS